MMVKQTITEQQLLSKLHHFFEYYNGKKMQTRTQMLEHFEKYHKNPTKQEVEEFKKSTKQGNLELDKFEEELKNIINVAIKSWGLKKTKEFIDRHANDFADYDISFGTRSMKDVNMDKQFSPLYAPLGRKYREQLFEAKKLVQGKFGVNKDNSMFLRWIRGLRSKE